MSMPYIYVLLRFLSCEGMIIPRNKHYQDVNTIPSPGCADGGEH
jgi:hypothetical protein